MGCRRSPAHRQAGRFPGLQTAFEDISLAARQRRQTRFIRASACARTAVQDRHVAVGDGTGAAIEPAERHVQRARYPLPRELIRFSNIDEHRAIADQGCGLLGGHAFQHSHGYYYSNGRLSPQKSANRHMKLTTIDVL